MSTFQQLQRGLHRGWENLAEGWQHLRERASHALTRFHADGKSGNLETAEEQFARRSATWGLLAAEVQERDDEVEVRLEAPGMEAEDFDLQVLDDVLLVRGEKRFQRSEKRGDFHLMECAYGRFERAIPMPVPVEETGAKARYRRGVLTVRLPRQATAVKRRISVTVD